MEEKIYSFFEKVRQNVSYQICFFIFIMMACGLFYLIVGNVINREVDKRYYISSDDYTWMYQVDTMQVKEGCLHIDGWAFELGKEAESEGFKILLYDKDTNTAYYPEMLYKEREDVNDYFLCEYDYSKSGFEAQIKLKKLDADAVYEVLLRPGNARKVYATGIFYFGEKMYFTNPKGFQALEVSGTDLEEVVNNGKLRVYQPDVGMYVYQYENSLYWIALPTYNLQDSNGIIQFHAGTTQINNLPQYRVESGLTWANMSFEFSAKEIVDLNTGAYRVACMELPHDFSCTKMWTGKQEESNWIWNAFFRPWLEP